MRYVLSDFVESDLEEIADYIARDSPRYAAQTVRKIRTLFRVLAANPYHYRLRSDLRPELRTANMGQYTVLFRIADEVVYIERVLHGMRDLPRQLG